MAMTPKNYQTMMANLLPKGRLWKSFRTEGSTGALFLGCFGAELSRCEALLWKTIDEAFPDTTDQLFYNWLRAWGIPDQCLKTLFPDASDSELRRQLVLKIFSQTYEPKELFKQIAESFGYEIAIEEPLPFCVNSSVSDSLYDAESVFTWIVVTTKRSQAFFDVCWPVKEGLSVWGDSGFECLIRSLSPAHLTVSFKYEENTNV